MAVQNVNMFSPYLAEQTEIERRRRIAEALQMQGMQPIEIPQTPAGGFAVPISPMQGLAKIAQSLMGGYGQRKSAEETKALGERYSKDRSTAVTQALAAGAGSPEQPEKWSGEAADELYTPAQAAVPPDRTKVYQALAAQGNFPELQTLGITEMLKEEKFGHEPRFTADGKPYLISDKGTVKWLDPASVTPRVKMEPLTNVAGPSGPETQFYDPYNPPKTPISQAVKREHVPGVGPTGQPNTTFVNPYSPPQGGVQAPAPGFIGQLQSIGLLQPGQENDPRVQAILSGYLGKESGQITPREAVELGIRLRSLSNEAVTTNFNTTGGASGVPVPVTPFSLANPAMKPPGFGGGGAMIGRPQQPATNPAIGPRSLTPTNQPLIPRTGPIPQQWSQSQITPKMRAEWEADKPRATEALKNSTDLVDAAIADINKLLGPTNAGHPGLSNITGGVMGRLPSVLPDSTNAQAIYDSLTNKLSINALNTIRSSSKTGGGVGTMTEKEWPIMANMWATTSQIQSAPQMIKSLKEIKARLENLKRNEAIDFNLKYRGGDRGAIPSPTGNPHAGKSDEQIKRELGL